MTKPAAAPRRAKRSTSRRKAGGGGDDALPRTLQARSRPADTTLQRHVSFFDDDGDRSVDVAECARGLRALGLAIGVAEAAALAIVVPLSVQTRGSRLAMRIDIDAIQKGKHATTASCSTGSPENTPRTPGPCAIGQTPFSDAPIVKLAVGHAVRRAKERSQDNTEETP